MTSKHMMSDFDSTSDSESSDHRLALVKRTKLTARKVNNHYPLNLEGTVLIPHSDPDTNHPKFYVYGGTLKGDKDGKVEERQTNNLSSFDGKAWVDLTKAIHFEPEQRFETSLEPLPAAIDAPASALFTFKSSRGTLTNYIFFFGGRRIGRTGKSVFAEIVFIDLKLWRWGYLTVSNSGGQGACNRIGASMVAVENRLYIFGGTSETPPTPLASYSVLQYEDATHTWVWATIDQDYPAGILHDSFSSALFDPSRNRIVLAPGKTGPKSSKYNLCEQNIVLYDIATATFSRLSGTKGMFPGEIARCTMVYCGPAAKKVHIQRHKATHGDPSPYILLVGWSSYVGKSKLLPEVWRLFLSGQIECVGVRAILAGSKEEWHHLVRIGGRTIFLGCDDVKRNPKLNAQKQVDSQLLIN